MTKETMTEILSRLNRDELIDVARTIGAMLHSEGMAEFDGYTRLTIKVRDITHGEGVTVTSHEISHITL